MRVLITGATGFIGSAVIKRLLPENFKLVAAVLDSENGGFLPAEVKRLIVSPLSENTNYGSTFDGVDVVIHLAARVHIMRDIAADSYKEFRKINLHGTENLARQTAKAGVKRLVFISTVKVHGEESPVPYLENSPMAPIEPYGISKAEAESALRRIAEETGMEVVIVRAPLVYGPGVKANFLRLIDTIWRGMPLPLASIRNQRSLIYVGNLADALFCCAIHPCAAGRTYLVSDGEDVSTPVLVRRVASALGKRARLFPFPPVILSLIGSLCGKENSVARILGSLAIDGSKIKKELGWEPPFSMTEGLLETARWYRLQKTCSNAIEHEAHI